MASSVPIVRQVAWLSIVPQIVVLLAIIAVATAVGIDNPALVGLLCYLALLFAVRWLIPKHHRRGMRLVRQERFAEAIPEFRRSYDFFVRREWLDRWRAITILSSSRSTYREMALLNVAFCLAQTGDGDGAIAGYRQVLKEFPGSKMAQTAVRMLELPRGDSRAGDEAASD